ncbi:DUF393 domain-containing protein [Undibacterium cyanobacteriorum]|uniref:DUF393 domain-containing protein n=1 Tax=Undibacterium cyanobacteriorum TaxID=3073561 RepID=A0ABY9RLB2_9BURK|nr:DUF393 domain-containing protein [Undibacterium sp. 20NA77.5]WMW82011.1 DUF393 domain-containing protein [Undibacterium sp. 20NA77.5]
MNHHPSPYPLTIYYDESCPLCKLEMDNLKARNHAEKLRFIDVSADDFADADMPVDKKDMMDIIHARTIDGDIINGVEVFRLAYSAVGLGWVTAPTKLPGIKQLSDWLYPHIAKNRYRLSNRFSGLLFKIARDRAAARAAKNSRRCHDQQCSRE